MCQWKFLVLRYSANTSERSTVNSAEISRTAFSERVVGVVSDVFCNMWVTSSVIGRVTAIAQAEGDPAAAYRTAYRSSSFPDASIKKTFSLLRSSLMISTLHLHVHRTGRRHQHVVVQIGHDPYCTDDHHEYDEQAEGEREDVVGAVRAAGDVEEKHQVNAHLGNGEDRETEAHAARPEQRRVGNPEGRRRENERHQQADGVDQSLRGCPCLRFLARDVSGSAIVSNDCHMLTPIR